MRNLPKKISGNMEKTIEVLKELGEVSRSDERLADYGIKPTTFDYNARKLLHLGLVEQVNLAPTGKHRPRKVYRLKENG